MRINKRMSLLHYWTSRYLLTLCIGLTVIGIISAMWIRHTTLENRLNISIVMAEGLADRFSLNHEEQLLSKVKVLGLANAKKNIDFIGSHPNIYIVEQTGEILAKLNPLQDPLSYQKIPRSFLENKDQVQKLTINEENSNQYYLVKAPIKANDLITGWVVILQNKKDLIKVNQEYSQLAILLVSLGILGWAAIYYLSRKLSRPIKQVAQAAQEVQEGNYDIVLSEDFKEKEVYELVASFKEMTKRLQQLETVRTQLLASVTHELKTPVTSIRGLLQALKDEVVTGDEAKEFLTISVKETERLQKMVADLLEFNAFAANTLPLKTETLGINELVNDISHQWKLVHENSAIDLNVTLLEKNAYVIVDPARLQQIMENLLNNAKQAMLDHGKISITLSHKNGFSEVQIDINDNGVGIPPEEQSLIFERFYRGENKKFKVRGLGLGLPFSKIMAKSMGGDLFLKESSPKGTIFSILLPITK